jgi:endoribonuclease Dicer
MSNIYLDPEFMELRPEQIEHINLENRIALPKITAITLSPREYQYEIFKKAISENIVAVLDTGAGKTLIAVMLIKHTLAVENERLQSNKDYKVSFFFFLLLLLLLSTKDSIDAISSTEKSNILPGRPSSFSISTS